MTGPKHTRCYSVIVVCELHMCMSTLVYAHVEAREPGLNLDLLHRLAGQQAPGSCCLSSPGLGLQTNTMAHLTQGWALPSGPHACIAGTSSTVPPRQRPY